MFAHPRKLATALALGTAVVLAPASWAHAQGNQQTADGLVNVQVGDVTIARNVAIDAVAGIVANVCPAVDVSNVAALATQIDQQGGQSTALCDGTAQGATGPVTIVDNPGGGGGGGQANHQNADGLVNVQAGNVTIARNVAIAAVAGIVANVCPVIAVSDVAALATQIDQQGGRSNALCDATAQGSTGPVTIVDNSGGGGGQANHQDADGLVNVQVGNVSVLENDSVAAAVDLVANICPGVDVSNVAVLATQVAQRGGSSGAICNGTANGATGPVRIVNSR